jgi:hypothetical protein
MVLKYSMSTTSKIFQMYELGLGTIIGMRYHTLAFTLPLTYMTARQEVEETASKRH